MGALLCYYWHKLPRPKKMDPLQAATMLHYAELWGYQKAATEFGVSLHTVTRYRSKLNRGDWPELLAAYNTQSKRQAGRTKDLLDRVYDRALEELEKKLPEASPRDVIGGVKILGELRMAQRALGQKDNDDERCTRDDRKGQAMGEDGGADESPPAPPVVKLRKV